MGTEQENTGLSDADANALFKDVFGSLLSGKDPEMHTEEQKEPEVTPVEQSAQEVTNEEAAPVAATENTETEPQTQQDNNDPLAALPEDIRNRIIALEKERDDWRHKYKSNEGRVVALNNKSMQLEKQLRAQLTKPTDTPSQVKLKVEESEEWRALSESDPVLAKVLKSSLEDAVRQAKEQAVSEARAAVQPLYQEREQDYHSREEQKLRQMVPNLDEVVQSDVYADWYNQQPKSIQDMANSSADEAIRVLEMYAMDMQKRYGAPVETKPAPAAAASATPAPVAKIQQERERKVQTQGVAAKTQAAPQELNEEDYFKKVFNQTVKRSK